MTDKLKNAGILLIFFLGALGGGTLFLDILTHFSVPDLLCDIAALVYWCAYCMLFSKMEFRKDKQSDYNRGHTDGYADGHEEGLRMGLLAANKALRDKYDQGYDEGYENGRADGWDQGYASAQYDLKK